MDGHFSLILKKTSFCLFSKKTTMSAPTNDSAGDQKTWGETAAEAGQSISDKVTGQLEAAGLKEKPADKKMEDGASELTEGVKQGVQDAAGAVKEQTEKVAESVKGSDGSGDNK